MKGVEPLEKNVDEVEFEDCESPIKLDRMVKKSSSRKITPMLKKESNEDNKVVTPIAN